MDAIIKMSGQDMFITSYRLSAILVFVYMIINTLLFLIGNHERKSRIKTLMDSPAILEINKRSENEYVKQHWRHKSIDQIKFTPLPFYVEGLWVRFIWGSCLGISALSVYNFVGLMRMVDQINKLNPHFALSSQDGSTMILMIVGSLLTCLPAIYISTFLTDRRYGEIDIIEICVEELKSVKINLRDIEIKYLNAQKELDDFNLDSFADSEYALRYKALSQSERDRVYKEYQLLLQKQRIIPVMIELIVENIIKVGSDPYKNMFHNMINAYIHSNLQFFEKTMEEAYTGGALINLRQIREEGPNNPEIPGQANDVKALKRFLYEVQTKVKERNAKLRKSKG